MEIALYFKLSLVGKNIYISSYWNSSFLYHFVADEQYVIHIYIKRFLMELEKMFTLGFITLTYTCIWNVRQVEDVGVVTIKF